MAATPLSPPASARAAESRQGAGERGRGEDCNCRRAATTTTARWVDDNDRVVVVVALADVSMTRCCCGNATNLMASL